LQSEQASRLSKIPQVEREELKALQAPLKDRYKTEPELGRAVSDRR